MKKKRKKQINNIPINSEDTFEAKVSIVMYPKNIKYYSSERNDYTELAMTAIKRKASVIKYIPSSYKDYQILCEAAMKEDISTFLLIKESVSNYKELGIEAITEIPLIVTEIDKRNKYYCLFWEFAVSQCYDLLSQIHKEQIELFPIIKKAINKEPIAIWFVDSDIPIYNELCYIAYKKNKETTKYMNINSVDKHLLLDILRKDPKRISKLNGKNPYYEEACKITINADGRLIKDIDFSFIKEHLDSFFGLINIAQKNNPEILECSNVIYALLEENRQIKEKILSVPNFLGDNLYELLTRIDNEYEELQKKYREAIDKEPEISRWKIKQLSDDCPIHTKIRKQ